MPMNNKLSICIFSKLNIHQLQIYCLIGPFWDDLYSEQITPWLTYRRWKCWPAEQCQFQNQFQNLSLLIRTKKVAKSVCFAYCLPPFFEPSYFHNPFKASELVSLMETLPSELTKKKKGTGSAPEELFPLEVWRHGDHWEIRLTSSLKALALCDRTSAASWEK